jgi:hypothetical protein
LCGRARGGAQLASPAWPLDSLQPRASAISRSPSVAPPSITWHSARRQASRQTGRIHVLFAPLRLLAPSALTRLRGRCPSLVRATPSSACWVLGSLGFKGTLEPAGLACWVVLVGALGSCLRHAAPQGLLILYHLGRPPLVAGLSFVLDAIPDTHTSLPTKTATSLPTTAITTTSLDPFAYASLLRLSLHTVTRLTIAGLRQSGYSYRPHLHLRLSTAKLRA